jgi:hypothetical protein
METEIKPTGEVLRDTGIATVLENNLTWAQDAVGRFHEWLGTKPSGFEFVFEDFRLYSTEQGAPMPSHPNAWGGLSSHLGRAAAIASTGRLLKTRDAKNHACKRMIYVKL